jgi:hypothetical protein
MRFLTMLANRLSPYDIYERHAISSQLLQKWLTPKPNKLILDVGGRIALLDRFLPYQTISINPDGSGHIIGDGGQLPFAANTFDAVVNIDTLEHLPSHIRLPFIQECLRVSRQVVIVAAPYGSEAHIQREKRLNDLHRQIVGRPHQYLNEHVTYGLPSPEQLASFTQKLLPATSQFYYAGDYTWQGRSFARAVQAHQQPRMLARFTNLYNRLSGMALFHPIALSTAPTPNTNRFYLVISKSA